MDVQNLVENYLSQFSQWLDDVESKVVKSKAKAKPSSRKKKSEDLLSLITSLKKRVNNVAKHVKDKDLAHTFCAKAEKCVNDISKTLSNPKSLPEEIVTGLLSLKKIMVDAVFSLVDSYKDLHTNLHASDKTHGTLAHHAPQLKVARGTPQNLQAAQRGERRHSFTRTGKS